MSASPVETDPWKPKQRSATKPEAILGVMHVYRSHNPLAFHLLAVWATEDTPTGVDSALATEGKELTHGG